MKRKQSCETASRYVFFEMRNDVEFGPLYVHLHNDILLGKSLINDELSKIDKVDVNFFTVPDIQQAAG